MNLADLHIHSNFSDGSDSVDELCLKIKESGLKIVALTDHDTMSGCELFAATLDTNIHFIAGIELTCQTESLKCHLLGYNCNSTNQDLINLIEKGKLLRKQKLDCRIKYLQDRWNIFLTKEENDWLYSRKSVVKTHLANILVKRNLAPDNLNAMRKYLDGCKVYNSRFDIKEAIKTIKSAGGIPTWAHPLGGEGEKHYSKEEFEPKLKQMINLGIEALECYYPRYNKEEINYLIDLAEKNNLLISAGSDYHGFNKNIPLAQLNIEKEIVPLEKITILKKLM